MIRCKCGLVQGPSLAGFRLFQTWLKWDLVEGLRVARNPKGSGCNVIRFLGEHLVLQRVPNVARVIRLLKEVVGKLALPIQARRRSWADVPAVQKGPEVRSKWNSPSVLVSMEEVAIRS